MPSTSVNPNFSFYPDLGLREVKRPPSRGGSKGTGGKACPCPYSLAPRMARNCHVFGSRVFGSSVPPTAEKVEYPLGSLVPSVGAGLELSSLGNYDNICLAV